MADKERADVVLAARNFFESREKARVAIMEGKVFLGDRRIMKPSQAIGEDDEILVKDSGNDYVSRGALKLEKAVRVFHAELCGRTVLDIGASTGGFTDVCLRNGAKHVYSVDVGYGQLDWKLRNDPRVTVMERTNARFLEAGQFADKPEIAVMDVSFISVRLIIPALIRILGDNGIIYTLIKPQFEAGRKKVGKNGVIRDPAVHEEVLTEIASFADSIGWPLYNLDYSPITGPKGNIEFIAEIRNRTADQGPSDIREKIRSIVFEAHDSLLRDNRKGAEEL